MVTADFCVSLNTTHDVFYKLFYREIQFTVEPINKSTHLEINPRNCLTNAHVVFVKI